ncbi:OmpL47-type beta-barrel domain-containing protein [Mesobacillus maritimus]|uniref:OmpL47-type beta-barrel domain-containing protein n=1 Tax=Mesobacillus maritimus TaxID=1643336 RepID=UPI00384DE72E
MKNKKSLVALLLVVVMVFSVVLPATSFAASDVTAPTLHDFTVSAKEATVGDTVRIVADVTDDLSGVQRVSVRYEAPEGTGYKYVPLEVNPETGKYEGTFVIGQYDATGHWNISYIAMYDHQGNHYLYQNSNGGNETKYKDYEYKDLSQYDVLVSGTEEDKEPPTLNKFIVSPTNVEIGDLVKIEADVTDDISGVKRVSVRYEAPEGTSYKYVPLELNQETGMYEGTIEIDQFDAIGNWTIAYIAMYDHQDNHYLYQNSNGRAETKYEDYEYKDLSEFDIVISEMEEDKEPPVLQSFTVSPQQVKKGDTVKIEADVTDDFSGVERVSVRYEAPEGTSYKYVPLDVNPETGKYEGTFGITQYDAIGTWKIEYIALYDNQGNSYLYQNRKNEMKYEDYEYKNLSEYDVVVEEFDQQAPVTNMDIESSSPKNGEWYSSYVTVSLNADDDQGVDKTFYKINDGDWIQYKEPFDIQDEGLTTIAYKSVDKAGNEEAEQSEVIQFDQTAPVTSASDVPENWTNENVAVTLEGTDEISGVAFTEYRMNNGEWTEYKAPIQVTEDGNNVIEYRSVNVAGNVEEAQHVEVKIDKMKPTLHVSFDQSVITKKNHKLVPIKSTIVSDDSLSGVASVELVSIKSNQADNGSGDGNTEQDIQGFEIGTADTAFLVRAETTANEDRIYTVTYKATDNAGNEVLATEEIRVKGNQAK